MKLEAGKHQIYLDDSIGMLKAAGVVIDNMWFNLTPVPLIDLMEYRTQAIKKCKILPQGMPILIAVSSTEKGTDLSFYPEANKDYEIKVQYYPPLKQV